LLALYNANIHTLYAAQPYAEALLIDHGKVLLAGSNQEIFSASSEIKIKHDLGGYSVIPGLTDAHIHLEQYAFGLQKVDCETDTMEECLRRVAERAHHTPRGEWVLGHGWNQNNWTQGFGTAENLDSISANNPVYLTAKSLHAGWSNSYALRLANITSETSDPPGGQIGRDAHGKPNGILYESAMELVSRAIPEHSVEQTVNAIWVAQQSLWQVGITAAHDFDRRLCFQALQILHQRGELGIRVLKSIPLEDLPHAIGLGIRSGLGDDFLRIGSLKAFADGALGPRTAAMLQPYNGEPENRGMLLLDREDLAEHGRQAVEHGISLAVHAIGDRANHEVLDAFDQIRSYERQRNLTPARHRIEHVQLIHPQDVDRLARLSIVASMQPIHATSDMLMADRYWGERSNLAYAWRSQQKHGATLAFGSDAPVESPNPFWGLHAAVTRQRADGTPAPDGWYPAERLNLLEAIQAYTTGAAYTAGMEDRLGKLAPGYHADLIVLPSDPFKLELNQIRDLRPVSTMVAGTWVHQSHK
jgi:hypothetical protein